MMHTYIFNILKWPFNKLFTKPVLTNHSFEFDILYLDNAKLAKPNAPNPKPILIKVPVLVSSLPIQ